MSVQAIAVPPVRERVVADCCQVIDDEVRDKGGLSGVAIKGAYKVVKTVKPSFLREVVDGMLDDWVVQLEPIHAAWQQAGGTKRLGEYLVERRGEVADALLHVTDGKAQQSKNATVKKLYEKMRPSARKHVEEAVPRLSRVIEKHAAP